MNLSDSITPRSDQINADDLMAGPRTVTVVEVRKGTAEQPVNVVTEEFGPGRPYKPSKSMRRIMVVAWGSDSDAYAGRQMTLFRNPTIRFGKDEVGGIQIAAMSHLDGPLKIALTVTRGKRAPFEVQPLGPVVVRDWLAELEEADGDPDLITALGRAAASSGATAEILNTIRQAYHAAKEQAEGDN